MEKTLFTSESVSEGHPDKVADLIADSILDRSLELDPHAHSACEVFVSDEFVLIGGEVTNYRDIDAEGIARSVLRKIGYLKHEDGIGCDSCKVVNLLRGQSADIAQGVDRGTLLETGAGDQGFMFGYATKESEGYMPLPISIAHKLVRVASSLRHEGKFPHARPDMKSQVTVDYGHPGGPSVHTILMSVQTDEGISIPELQDFLYENVMLPVVDSFHLNRDFRCLVNPTGRFVIGGPAGDTGLTGRKLVVDTYGGSCRHGGGAFSGKDPTKVDRSASYYARYIAKNLVAAGAAERLEIQLSYAIGVAKPLSVGLTTFHTRHYEDEVILEAIERFFDARPGAIIEQFSLQRPSFKYADTTNYGCFGRPDIDLPWEKLDKVAELKEFFKGQKRI